MLFRSPQVSRDLSHHFTSPWKPAAKNSFGCCRNHARTALRYLSALPRTSAPNYGLPDVTGNVHRTWQHFFVDILCFYIFCPKKTHNATLFYLGTCTQGPRHLLTVATSVQSSAYRSLCVTMKLESAAI